MDNPTDWGKFFGTLLIISLIGSLGVAGLERAFGIIPVFVTFTVVTLIVCTTVIVIQIKDQCKKEKNTWVKDKIKEITNNLPKNDKNKRNF